MRVATIGAIVLDVDVGAATTDAGVAALVDAAVSVAVHIVAVVRRDVAAAATHEDVLGVVDTDIGVACVAAAALDAMLATPGDTFGGALTKMEIVRQLFGNKLLLS